MHDGLTRKVDPNDLLGGTEFLETHAASLTVLSGPAAGLTVIGLAFAVGYAVDLFFNLLDGIKIGLGGSLQSKSQMRWVTWKRSQL